MSEIAKALEDVAQKAEQGLAKDFSTAYHGILRDTEQKATQVADHVAENEARTAAELAGKDAASAGESALHDPHPGGEGAGRGPGEPSPGAGREQVANPREAGRPEEAVCQGGEPVDMATGRMFIDQVDVELPGALPLVFTRCFESGYLAGRWMGRRWVCSFDERLEIDDQGVVHLGADRRAQAYDHPEPGAPTEPSAGTRRRLAVDARGRFYTLRDRSTGLVREFTVRPDGREALLTRVRDRVGHVLDYRYAPDGTPVEIVHSGGYRLLVSTADGRITALRLADPAAQGGEVELLRYGYTGGNLTEVFNSSGLPMRFGYDADDRVVSWTDRNGSHYTYTYDPWNRVVEEGGADGAMRFRFAYGAPDPATGLKVYTETDALGHTTAYHVNEHAQIAAVVDPLGNTTRYDRDAYDNLLAETDPLGRTTRYAYDSSGDLVAVTRPDGEQVRMTYEGGLGRPTEVAEPGGVVWRYSYDAMGRRTSSTDPAGATTCYGYDEAGHLSSVTDALGQVVRLVCDSAGLPVRASQPGGMSVRYERDSFGRVVSITDQEGNVTRLGWTVEGYPRSRTAPDGSTETWEYDGEGNIVSHRDRSGHESTFAYTHFENLAAATTPTGERYTYTYDHAMRLVAVTNPLGQRWTYAYDAAGRLVGETDFHGRTAGYGVDAAGRTVTRTNAAGQTVEYRYDLLDRVVEKRADGQVTTYAYDPAGRLLQASGTDALLTRTVDACGRVLTESVNGRTLSRTWDVLGRRTRRATPSGHISEWIYDGAGRPCELSSTGGRLAFSYDALGRERTRTIDHGLTLLSEWDSSHRLTRQALESAADPRVALQERRYSYREDGHVTAVADQLRGLRRFDVDPGGRVTAVHGAWDESYSYDPAGNITHADWPTSGASSGAEGQRSYIGTQLTAAGRVRYEYDAAGRVVLRQRTRLSRKPETWRFEWDAEDRLKCVTTPDGVRWRYLYDPFGRRIAKQRLAPDGVIVEEQTCFTWDGPLLVEQTTEAGYLPGPHTLSWDYQGFQPVAQTEAITAQERIDRRFFAIVTDLVGTPTELVDSSDGSIAWRGNTTLWGNTTWPRESATYTPLRFPGQYFDPESRLHYNVFRYYDPETARYTSPDPLGIAPAANPDAYVENPVTWHDPLGLSPHNHDDLLAAVKKEADDSTSWSPSKNRPAVAEGIKLPNGQILTAPSLRGAAPVLHSDVQQVLEGIPKDLRGSGHGSCGLPQCLSSALDSGIDPTGSQAAAMIVRSSAEHPKHGFPIGPCPSCRVLTEHYDLDFITDDGK